MSGYPPSDPNRLHKVALDRKRAEEDVQLLLNRINLLRAEEEKTRKKADEVRDKAQTLRAARERREEEKSRKSTYLAEKSRREFEERQALLRAREVNRGMNRVSREDKSKLLAQVARADREARLEAIARVRDTEDLQQRALRERANHIRREEYGVQRARALTAMQRREEVNKAQEDRQLLEDNKLQDALEKLKKLEKDEMEAIAKLQNSQRIFQSARSEFEELSQLQPPALLPASATAQIDTGLRSRPPLPRTTRAPRSPRTPRGDSTREEFDDRKPRRSCSVPSSQRTQSTECGSDGTPRQALSSQASRAASKEGLSVQENPAERPQKMISYTTMDGQTVSIPVPDDSPEDDFELAATLNAR
jgi:hypothetical protein